MKSSNSAVSAQSLLGALALTATLSSVAQAAPTPTPQLSGHVGLKDDSGDIRSQCQG